VLFPKDESSRKNSESTFTNQYMTTLFPSFVNIARTYRLGDPTKPDTNLGPVVSLTSAERIREQVEEAGKLELILRVLNSSRGVYEVEAGAKKIDRRGRLPDCQTVSSHYVLAGHS